MGFWVHSSHYIFLNALNYISLNAESDITISGPYYSRAVTKYMYYAWGGGRGGDGDGHVSYSAIT